MGWDEGGSELEPLLSPHRPSAATATMALGNHTGPAQHQDTVDTTPALHSTRDHTPALHGTGDVVDAVPALHYSGDMGDATPALLGTRTRGTPHWPCSARNTPAQPRMGDATPALHGSRDTGVLTFGEHWAPGGRDAGCSGKGVVCPVTRCHASAPRGPFLWPGTVPGPPCRPRAPGLKPAAASAP